MVYLMAPLVSPGVPQGSGRSAGSPRRGLLRYSGDGRASGTPPSLCPSHLPPFALRQAASRRRTALSRGQEHGQVSPSPGRVVMVGDPCVGADGPAGTAHSSTSLLINPLSPVMRNIH